MKRMRLAPVFCALWLAALAPAHAANLPPERDQATADRIKHLEGELRCLVCQGQSVAESDSDFSGDIRREIDRMVAEGQTDQQIKDFLVARYGEFILYRPPLQPNTLPLWLGPALLMPIALGGLYIVLRRRGAAPRREVSDEERRRAAALLADADQARGKSSE